MIVFNDDYLERYKELAEKCYPLDCEMTLALIKRLEASEKLAEHHSGHDEDCGELDGEKCSCGYEKADDAWRKAAGK